MKAPKVSVLIPTYNYARFLPEAIASVLAQDFTDFELLVVDDASQDDTAAVVPQFTGDARFQFIRQPHNIGMVNNWNFCVDRARGEYLKFIFGDDKFTQPGALGKLVQSLDNAPSAVMSSCGRVFLDEHSNVTSIWQPLDDGCLNGREVIIQCIVESANLIGEPSTVLLRAAAARGGFNPNFRQVVDMEMWFRLLEGGDLAYTREPLCAFRQHSAQQSAVNDEAGTAKPEHALLMAEFAMKPWMTDRAGFAALFGLRRFLRKHPGSQTPALLQAEKNLCQRLGREKYCAHWVRYKMINPLANLRRSFNKRRVLAQSR